jgi:hypothetical protein
VSLRRWYIWYGVITTTVTLFVVLVRHLFADGLLSEQAYYALAVPASVITAPLLLPWLATVPMLRRNEKVGLIDPAVDAVLGYWILETHNSHGRRAFLGLMNFAMDAKRGVISSTIITYLPDRAAFAMASTESVLLDRSFVLGSVTLINHFRSTRPTVRSEPERTGMAWGKIQVVSNTPVNYIGRMIYEPASGIACPGPDLCFTQVGFKLDSIFAEIIMKIDERGARGESVTRLVSLARAALRGARNDAAVDAVKVRDAQRSSVDAGKLMNAWLVSPSTQDACKAVLSRLWESEGG